MKKLLIIALVLLTFVTMASAQKQAEIIIALLLCALFGGGDRGYSGFRNRFYYLFL